MSVGVDDFQFLVGAHTNGVDVKQIVGDHLDKSRGVVDGRGEGFVQILAKLAPENVEREFGGGFTSAIFLDLGGVEVDTLSHMVLSEVLALLLGSFRHDCSCDGCSQVLRDR